MGKKHKKHKSGWQHAEDNNSDKTPLKLVLKLGSEVMYDSDYAAHSPATTSHDASSHKHKKRKKKRHHDEPKELRISSLKEPLGGVQVASPYVDSEMDFSSPEMQAYEPQITQEIVAEVPLVDDIPIETPKKKKFKKITGIKRKALNSLLEHVLKQLERKDPHDIFAWPVNDMIAPGYSSLIEQPMDFSTMRNKIITDQYSDVNGFKVDFELMTSNCCIYNKPETVYYNIAKKVLAAGIKIMSKERLRNMKRTLGFLHELSKQDVSDILGLSSAEEEETTDNVSSEILEDPVSTLVDLSNESEQENVQISVSEEFDLRAHPDAISFTDADNEDTVAPDAIQAMKLAQQRLARKKPKDRIGYLRMDKDGKTTLNILNPERDEEAQREVDLGSLLSNSSSGIDVMPEAKEDKRNKVTPLQYLSYGPFGSYAPTYDSRVSNLTQEESDLLLSAYGSDTGYLFATSMQDFVSNSDKGLIRMVGDLLDTVTHGAHGQAIQEITDKRNKIERKKSKSSDQSTNSDVKVNFDELRSLKELGIDISFVDDLESKQLRSNTEQNQKQVIANERSEKITESLDHGTELIKKLEQVQYKRLSMKPTNNEPNLNRASEKERQIAEELQQTLADLTASTTPGMVCDETGVQKAMGVVVPTT